MTFLVIKVKDVADLHMYSRINFTTSYTYVVKLAHSNFKLTLTYHVKFNKLNLCFQARSHGVMVSTLDFESSDPSSNLGGT